MRDVLSCLVGAALAALGVSVAWAQSVDDLWMSLGESFPSPLAGFGVLATDSSSEVASSIALDRTGRAILVSVGWGPLSHGDVYVRHWDGHAWKELGAGAGSGGGVSNSPETQTQDARAAVDSLGNPVVAWEEGGGNIRIRRWDGSAWVEVGEGSGGEVGIPLTGEWSDLQALVVGTDDQPLVGWVERRPDVFDEVRLANWNGTMWTRVGTDLPGPSGNLVSLSVAIARDGDPVISWSVDRYDAAIGNYRSYVYLARWNGTAWEPIGVGSTSGHGISEDGGHDPVLSLDALDRPAVAFSSGHGLIVMRWDGMAWVDMGPGVSYNYTHTLALDPDGNPALSWEAPESGQYYYPASEIHLLRWDGSQWRAVSPVTGSGSVISDYHLFASFPLLALDDMGNPTVAWTVRQPGEPYGPGAPVVRHHSGQVWTALGGGSEFRDGMSMTPGASVHPSITINSEGMPLVAWEDNNPVEFSSIYIRRWNGILWEEMGAGSASASGASGFRIDSRTPSMDLGADGKPVVAWAVNDATLNPYPPHYTRRDHIFVRRWSGSAWEEIGAGSASGEGISGSMGVSTAPSLAHDSLGHPAVAWQNSATTTGVGLNEIHVRRWDGSQWAEIGAGSATGGGISNDPGDSVCPSLAFDGDHPIVAWQDNSSGNEEIYVRRWNGAEWAEVGAGSASGEGISRTPGASRAPSLAVDAEGNPMVAWQDDSGGVPAIYVRRWTGSEWAEVGAGSASGEGISGPEGKSLAPALRISTSGVPVLAWQQATSAAYRIHIRAWNGAAWVEIGTGSASGGGISDSQLNSEAPALALDPLGNPVVAWKNHVRSRLPLNGLEIFVRTAGPGLSVPGSANSDSIVDVADLVTIINHINGTRLITYPPAFTNADVNHDLTIDGSDAEQVLGMLLAP